MNIRRCLLGTYRLMLQLYPPAFRERYATEMMEVATSAESAEWPLIFGDTSVAIVRCWIEGGPSAAAKTEADAYLPLGGFPIRTSGFLHGFVLSTLILLGMGYIAYRWPPPCSSSTTVLTHIVSPPQAQLHPAETTRAGRVKLTRTAAR